MHCRLRELGLCLLCSLPHSAMGWPAVCDNWHFLAILLSFFETIIIVDDNTIELHKIEL